MSSELNIFNLTQDEIWQRIASIDGLPVDRREFGPECFYVQEGPRFQMLEEKWVARPEIERSLTLPIPLHAPFRVAVLGGGNDWTLRALAAQLMGQGVELVAVAHPDFEAALVFAIEHDVPYAFSSLKEMIEQMHRLDGVIVAAPAAEQLEATLFALRQGLHVLCAEPFGTSRGEAAQMIAAAQGAGRVLAAGYLSRFQIGPFMQSFRQGVIGTTKTVEAVWRCPHGGGDDSDAIGSLLAAALPLLGAPIKGASGLVSERGSIGSGVTFVDQNGACARLRVVDGRDPADSELEVHCRGTVRELQVPLLRRSDAAVDQVSDWVRVSRYGWWLDTPPHDVLPVHEALEKYSRLL